MPTIAINKFDLGITNDPRDPREGVCRMSTNFDILTNPRKINPYRSGVDGDDAGNTSRKQAFAVALRTGTTHSLYALGVVSGTAKAEILYKNLTKSGTTDLRGNTWATPSSHQSSIATTSFSLFTYYARTSLIYGAKTNKIWAFSPSGSAFDEDVLSTDGSSSFNFTNIAQGLVHPKDDILYIPYDNKIAKNDNKTWNKTALTVPTHFRISSISSFGNYLAVGSTNLSSVGNSIVYLWNRDDSLTTLSESIDWGSGNLNILEEVNGELIGVSLSGNIASRLDDRVIFRRYTSSGAIKIGEFIFDSGGTTSLGGKQVIDNRLWFTMSGKINGIQRKGLWSIGRTPDGTFSIVQERTPNNDTSVDSLLGFIIVGDFVFQAHITSSVYDVTKTDDQDTYSATAIRETTINPGMIEIDRTKDKQLEAVTLSYESLPSSSSVVLFYRIDAGDWIKIFTETTSGTITTKERTKIDAGSEFTSGREYEFKIEATGAKTEITELKYKYKVLPTQM